MSNMPSILWLEIKGFVLQTCPRCAQLYGFTPEEEIEGDFKTIFKNDSKIKNILKRRNFDLDRILYPAEGLCHIEKRQRGSQFREELALKMPRPDELIDSEVQRLARLVDLYGKEYIRHAIFINRFEVVNLTKHKPLQYRYHIRWVPAFISPFAPFGLIQAVSPEEPEEEFEKLFFSGNPNVKPKFEISTTTA